MSINTTSLHSTRFCKNCKFNEIQLGKEFLGCGKCVEYYKDNCCKLHSNSWEKNVAFYCSLMCQQLDWYDNHIYTCSKSNKCIECNK